jgi:hypothetical protein
MRHFCTRNVILLSLLVGGIHAAAAEESFQQAQPANSSDFSLTGFTNVTGNAPSGGKATLNVDDLGVFGSGHINQEFNPFFEAELAGVTLLRQGGDPLAAGYPHLLLERLFNDSYLTSNLSLRVGKMLSPVGEWNLIHVPALVLTTTRPETTYRGFSEFTSGASVIYNGNDGSVPDIQVYVQPWSELRSRPQDIIVRDYEHVSGIHLNWPLGLNDMLGLSIQNAQVKMTGEQQTLAGYNFSKEFGPVELETEAFRTHISGANGDRLQNNEWGTYLQGAYALNERWHLVGRYEYFSDRGSIINSISTVASRNSLLGVAYKSASASPQVWKLEYIEQYGQQLDIQTGLYVSFSNLF